MGTRFDLNKVKSWASSTHEQVAQTLGCSLTTAWNLRHQFGLPPTPRKPGSGLNRYKNHPPALRKPWERVTDWNMPVMEIAALVGCSRTAVINYKKRNKTDSRIKPA